MPRILTLMRHGKSSWEYNLEDQYRPLKKRAYTDIFDVYSNFKDHLSDSTSYITSPAVRAQTTAKEFLKLAGVSDHKLIIESNLYTFDPIALQNLILSLDDSNSNQMLFGHNPAFTAVANHYGSMFFDNIPTSGLVRIRFEADAWKDISNGITQVHLFPKDLRQCK